MVEEQKPSDVEALKKELVEIKNEMMRKELEAIKREKMRQELEELKAEQAEKGPEVRYVRYKPVLSIPTTLMAIFTLVAAGYMIGTLFPYNLAADVDRSIAGYGFPITGAMVVAIVGVAFIFIGLGFVTMAKK